MRRRMVALVIVLAGCATTSVPSSPAASVMAEPSASRPTDVRELGATGQELAPGRYTRAGFEPSVTLTVADDGWVAQQVAAGFFDIQRDPGSLDAIAVQFANVVGDDTVDAIVAEIRENSNLVVSEPQAVEIDGISGTRLVVETSDPPDSQPPIFRQVLVVPAGPLSIASARRLDVTLLDAPGGVLAILVGGSIAEWDRTLELATPVVDSVTIGD